jgi:hypothetical protein
MTRLARLLWFRKDKKEWGNLRSSIGEIRERVRGGRYNCWEAIGPVGEVWTRLGPEIKVFVDDSCKPVPGLTFGIYMIGHTEDTARPKVLICSADSAGRKGIRKAIQESGILDGYPTIGLGDMARAPGLMAQEEIESIFQLELASDGETYVFSTSSDNAFGRRLFIPDRDGSSLRPATGGPMLYINGNIYQLTVGHAFLDIEGMTISGTESFNSDECDFDGQSDSEDMDTSINLPMADSSKCQSSNPTSCDSNDQDGNRNISNEQGSSSSPDRESLSSSLANDSSRDSGVDLSPENASAGNDEPQAKEPATAESLCRVGKLALLSETGARQSLDYGLVELEGKYRFGSNEIPYGPNNSQRFLQVRQAANIATGYVNTVTMTASSKFLSGKLCPTALYMWLSNQGTLQELYSVHLGGTLADGDCGAGVVDQATGHLYGHIVAGTAGSGVAYIVPAMQVFEDIVGRLGGSVRLEPETPADLSAKRTPRDPLRIVELGSKRYFSELEEAAEFNEAEMPATNAEPIASTPIPLTPETAIEIVEGQRQQHNIPSRLKARDSSKGLRSKFSFLRSNAATSKAELKGKGKELDDTALWTRNVSETRARYENDGGTSNHTFEERFFALPSTLQVQIIASLSVPDILCLRFASRHWHNLVSLNEVPIARSFLENNPVPTFVLSLYPRPNLRDINLHYIWGLWHRLSVASRLASVIAEWLAKEHFLRKEENDRLKFSPKKARMRRRLVPLLFLTFHFLEVYRGLQLKNPRGHGQSQLSKASNISYIEFKIMSMYDNETFLQAHQAFPLVVSFLRRIFRPPSYLGLLERSVRGYHSKPPPDHVLIAILCIGGLREVERFSRIEDYEARRMAVDEWYAAVAPEPITSGLKPHLLGTTFNRMQTKLTSFNSSEPHEYKPATISDNVSTLSNSGTWQGGRMASDYTSLIFDTSLASRAPMAPLPAQHVETLLLALPSLDNLWVPTAEALLLKRRVVKRRQDIKKYAEIESELVQEDTTVADRLFNDRSGHKAHQEDSTLTRGLIEELVFRDDEFSRLVGR